LNTKNLVLMAMLVAVGAALYLVVPGFNAGMKFDFMLIMMFVGMFLFPDARSVLLLAVSTGVVSGILSTIPGGFIPNVIDKLITAFVVFAVIIVLKKIAKNLIVQTVIAAIGTLLSGTIFLTIAIFLLGIDFGLNNPFAFLFVTVVLPTVVMNAVAFFIINPIVNKLTKRSSFKTAVSN
jgi:hypothetical protein